MTMCQGFGVDRNTPVSRPVPPVYEYAVAIKHEGLPGNVEVVRIAGTSINLDPHWVRVMNDRDAVLVVPAPLVRRVTRVEEAE